MQPTLEVHLWSVRLERASWSVCGVTSRALADLCKSQENARVQVSRRDSCVCPQKTYFKVVSTTMPA